MFRTKDGRYIGISASIQAMSERLFRAIGQEGMIADPRFRTNSDRVRHAEECEAPIAAFIAAAVATAALPHLDEREHEYPIVPDRTRQHSILAEISQSDLRVHVGLGRETTASKLEVRWAGGDVASYAVDRVDTTSTVLSSSSWRIRCSRSPP